MSDAPLVSIVITVLNAAATVGRCLDSLLELDYPKDRYEIIVVDALSTDGTLDVVRAYAARSTPPEIRVIEREGTIGAGRNEGVRQARGDLVGITDGDIFVSRSWLRGLLAAFELGERIAAVGGPNESAADDLWSRTVACIPVHGPARSVVPPFGRNRYGAPFVSNRDWYTNVTRNTMIRRDAFEAIGGFAEDLLATEDPDLNDRLHRSQWRTAYTPRAVVRHLHRRSLGAFLRQMAWYAHSHGYAARSRPTLRRPKQFLPTAAVATLAVLGFASAFSGLARTVALGSLAGGVGFLAVYGIRCAAAGRDARLAATAPFYFLAWQLAWAWHFPRGFVGRPAPRTR